MASDGREVRHAFHHKHGDGITLSHGNTVAKYTVGGSCTVFSRDPLEVSETFTVKLTDSYPVSNDVQTYCMITLLSVIDIDIVNVNTYSTWWDIYITVDIVLHDTLSWFSRQVSIPTCNICI